METRDIVILGGARAPICEYGGSFKDTPAYQLGAIAIKIKLLYELQRRREEYGLITMCIGGGQAIAAIVQNVA